jgi:hypothetical protein
MNACPWNALNAQLTSGATTGAPVLRDVYTPYPRIIYQVVNFCHASLLLKGVSYKKGFKRLNSDAQLIPSVVSQFQPTNTHGNKSKNK